MRSIKSALCRVARLTVTPPTKTGLQHRGGRELAAAADGNQDALKLSDGRLGGELVGDGPARGTAGVAEALLRGVGIHLEHHAVDLVAERVAALVPASS